MTPNTDWIALSKTVAIELAFLGSISVALFAHPSPDVLAFCQMIAVSTGATLGLLQLGTITANALTTNTALRNGNGNGKGTGHG